MPQKPEEYRYTLRDVLNYANQMFPHSGRTEEQAEFMKKIFRLSHERREDSFSMDENLDESVRISDEEYMSLAAEALALI